MEDIDLPLKRGSLNDIEKSQESSSRDVDESSQDAMEIDNASQVCFFGLSHLIKMSSN